jgi:hypothetical protein
MKRFTYPLDRVRIASPCSANWDAMYGNDRRRFCADCGLNVYNLSEMSKVEAESLMLNAEGRICVRVYRRHDGSVITRDCPKGLAALKRKTLRLASAAASVLFSLVAGVGMARFLKGTSIDLFNRPAPSAKERSLPKISFGGAVSNLGEIKAAILRDQ